ncbi:MAG TPA: IPT/TIG domain-containing protein [Gemmatimonadales bacterium]
MSLGLLLLALACRSDVGEPPETSVTLTAQSGSALSGFAGSRLLGAPLFMATDAAGEPVSNVVVSLQLVGGAGSGFSLPETRAASGPDGIVRADVVLGDAGEASISATSTRADQNAVAVVSALTPPTLSTVTPQAFSPGEELMLAGSGFPSVAAGAAVHVGGVPATVLESSPTALRVRAPACVTPGPASVVVTVDGKVRTNPVEVTALTGAGASVAPLDGVVVPAESAAGCVTLAGSGARYLIVPQYATRDGVSSSVASSRPGYMLGVNAVGAPVASFASAAAAGAPGSTQQRFDLALRRRESALAPSAAASGAHPPMEAPPLAALELNSTRTFNVLSDLSASDKFERVTGQLKFVGDNVLVYIDQNAPSGGFTDQQLDRLGRLFDRKLHRVATDAFGSTSDIDRNGHVVVLMTPVVNRLVDALTCEQQGYVTGFFYGLDLTPSRPNSNKGEIFYSFVPDPMGATGSCAHSISEVERMVPSTFVHELQHMISWNQHVLVRGGSSEVTWLNEGLSHIAEELASLIYENDPAQPRSTPEQIFPDSSQGYIVSNIGNAYEYLQQPADVSLTLFNETGSLEERGASWLFLRWLADQKGEQVLRRLVETSMTGVANIEDKAGEPFPRLFGDFGISMYAQSLPDAERNLLPSRYLFSSRDFRRIFRRFYDTDPGRVDYPTPFPIVPDTLRPGTSVSDAMVPGTMRWYFLDTAGADPALSLTFRPPAGGPFTAALGAQVGILRLPPSP